VSLGEDPDLFFRPKEFASRELGINTGGSHQTLSITFSLPETVLMTRGQSATPLAVAGLPLWQSISTCGARKYFKSRQKELSVVTQTSTCLTLAAARRWKRKRFLTRNDCTRLRKLSIGLTEAEVEREAARCFSCGVCIGCDTAGFSVPITRSAARTGYIRSTIITARAAGFAFTNARAMPFASK